MIKRSTWITLAVFLAVIAFALVQKYRPEEPIPTETPTEPPVVEYLFTPEDGVVTSIRIDTRDGQVFRAERSGSGWMVVLPIEGAADSGQMETAASQVTTLRVETHLDLDPDAVSLSPPQTTLTVGFSSGKTYSVGVGDITPIGDSYYVRKDRGDVLVIPRDGIDALMSLLTFPPYIETPTPTTPPPTETPTPSPTATK
ncbi:MAG: hypothetical protein ACOYZ8_11050 [Chloroflexota bacterium]